MVKQCRFTVPRTETLPFESWRHTEPLSISELTARTSKGTGNEHLHVRRTAELRIDLCPLELRLFSL